MPDCQETLGTADIRASVKRPSTVDEETGTGDWQHVTVLLRIQKVRTGRGGVGVCRWEGNVYSIVQRSPGTSNRPSTLTLNPNPGTRNPTPRLQAPRLQLRTV